MIKTSTIFYFPEIKQDTLVIPQQGQPQPSLNLTIRKPLLDLERAEEVIRQFEQREQEIIESQLPVIRPRAVPRLREPSIEVDSLMAKYQNIGCSPRANFPDTFTLTVLERYYQPITAAITPVTAIDATGTTVSAVPLQDSLQTSIPIKAETPDIRPGFATDSRPAGYPSSITLFLICGLALLAIIKYHFGKNLTEAFRSFFSYRQSLRLFEEHRESDRQATLLSNILFALVAGIFISVILPFFGTSPLWGNYAWSILFFSFATGLLYILKAWIWQMLGVVFLIQSFSKVYIYNMFLYNRNTGLFIFPLVAIIPYVTAAIMPYVVYSVLVIVALSYLFKLWRIFQIILGQNVSVFYFILYLCTLEILPLLLFIKGCKTLGECMVV